MGLDTSSAWSASRRNSRLWRSCGYWSCHVSDMLLKLLCLCSSSRTDFSIYLKRNHYLTVFSTVQYRNYSYFFFSVTANVWQSHKITLSTWFTWSHNSWFSWFIYCYASNGDIFVREMMISVGEEVEVRNYNRLTKLIIQDKGKLTLHFNHFK